MKANIRKKLAECKGSIEKRLEPRNWSPQSEPMFRAGAVTYEMAGRSKAIHCGGIGAMHRMAAGLGLVRDLNANLKLLKVHLPYHESDHVLNLCYNVLAGGTRLEDIELLRQDEAYMDALGAQRIPDPTTAGDFLRRFDSRETLLALMETINQVRLRAWLWIPAAERQYGIIDADGLIAGTLGECKAGMDMSHKGIWGYHPLLVSLANTGEPLYVVNRPGNVVSHDGAVEWLDRAVGLVRKGWDRVCLRGDTDFSLTKHFDRWTGDQVDFVFGFDARKNLVEIAEGLEKQAWKPLERPAKYTVKTRPRRRPDRVKEQIVQARGYENKRLNGEAAAEFAYRPTQCKQTYRVIVVRKDIRVEKGQKWLFNEYKYFFYITNRRDLSASEVVSFANDRCNQENVIEQLKNGVNAMRLPVADLLSNWAYMIIASLAWTLKAWFALLMPDPKAGQEVLRMEFRTFLHALIHFPCQIVRTGRRIVYRVLGYTPWLKHFFRTFDVIRTLRFG